MLKVAAPSLLAAACAQDEGLATLRAALDLREQGGFFYLLTDAPDLAAAALEVLLPSDRPRVTLPCFARGSEPWLPLQSAAHYTRLLEQLGQETSFGTVRVLDASACVPEDKLAWKALFRRWNQLRESFHGAHSRPMVCVFPPWLEPVFAEEAPDLWSIRDALVVDLDALPTLDLARWMPWERSMAGRSKPLEDFYLLLKSPDFSLDLSHPGRLTRALAGSRAMGHYTRTLRWRHLQVTLARRRLARSGLAPADSVEYLAQVATFVEELLPLGALDLAESVLDGLEAQLREASGAEELEGVVLTLRGWFWWLQGYHHRAVVCLREAMACLAPYDQASAPAELVERAAQARALQVRAYEALGLPTEALLRNVTEGSGVEAFPAPQPSVWVEELRAAKVKSSPSDKALDDLPSLQVYHEWTRDGLRHPLLLLLSARELACSECTAEGRWKLADAVSRVAGQAYAADPPNLLRVLDLVRAMERSALAALALGHTLVAQQLRTEALALLEPRLEAYPKVAELHLVRCRLRLAQTEHAATSEEATRVHEEVRQALRTLLDKEPAWTEVRTLLAGLSA